MAETDVTTQIVRQDPRLEQYNLNLLDSVRNLTNSRLGIDPTTGQPMPGGMTLPPNFQVANQSGLEQLGGALAEGGIGGYRPFLNDGTNTVNAAANNIGGAAIPSVSGGIGGIMQGQDYTEEAYNLANATRNNPYPYQTQAAGQFNQSIGDAGMYANQGIGAIQGTGAAFNPSGINAFSNPYEQSVINPMVDDIERARLMQENNIGANAVQAGAFGGSRHGLVEAENNRNALEQVAQSSANVRLQGYESAAQRAQGAFEGGMSRQQNLGNMTGAMGMNAAQMGLSGAGGIGSLGTSYGQLGQQDVATLASLGGQYGSLSQGIGSLGVQLGGLATQQGNIGMQQAGLGELLSGLNRQDIDTAMQIGGSQRGIQQSGLDANRQNITNAQNAPFQYYGYMSDILARTPSAQSTMQSQTSPTPSPFQQIAGLGIAGLGAANSLGNVKGLF